ncbi:DUF3304 domain-containing protein [Cupriavidus gilardii]|uniref:DUF3304 domain-containing protein n=1 Tax=Cupriavidus gilardii TaxID=82541 RepID=UPI001ABDC235|nr:DUF3304 domain-containing protein [Cupriavidus gilardii]
MRWIAVAFVACALGSCGDELIGTNVVGYNHTDKAIGHFTVNGGGGAYMEPHAGGGKFACCASVPIPWQPGLTMTVGWTDEFDENYRQRVVEVPKYDKVGDVAVHFLRNGEIKIFVTNYALWHPQYPLKGTEAQLRPGVDPIAPVGAQK